MRHLAVTPPPVLLAALLAVCLAASACAPTFNLLGAPDAPYAEQTVSGQATARSCCSLHRRAHQRIRRRGLLRPKPSVLEQVSAQLKLAGRTRTSRRCCSR
jgi:hypothetical protein